MTRTVLVCLLATIAIALADPMHNGLVAKWSSTPNDGTSFYNTPRTQAEAQAGTGENEWVQVDHNADQPFSVFCHPGDERFCLLFDLNGFIAGIQVGVALEDFEGSQFVYPFDRKDLFTMKNYFNKPAWTGTCFFVNPAVLQAGGRQNLNDGTLTELWLQYGPTIRDAKQIPLAPRDLETQTLFKLQKCLPSMGIHYYYEMIPTLDCADFDPWFLLYQGSDIVGIGFQNFGRPKARPGKRHYFETIALAGINLIAPDRPDCLPEWVETDGLISLHVFFVDKPLAISC